MGKATQWKKRKAKRDPRTINAVLGRKYKGDSEAGVYDIHPTPKIWTMVLLEYMSFHGRIWEPACGDGAMSKTLIEAGYKVVSTNLPDQGYGRVQDFLTTKKARAPNIVTNPPYRYGTQFIQHALKLVNYPAEGVVAMLLGLTALGGVARMHNLWWITPPRRIVIIPNHMPNIYTGTGYTFNHMWCIWDSKIKGTDCKINWLPVRRD